MWECGEGWSAPEIQTRALVLGEDFLVIKVSGRDTFVTVEIYPPSSLPTKVTIPLAASLGCVSIADRGYLPRL